MYRKLLPLMLVAGLAGCASTSTTPSANSSASPSFGGNEKTCDAESVQRQVGQPFTDALGNEVRDRSGSNTLRVLRPGQVMTLEYNPARVSIIIDGQGKISAIRCG